LLGLGLKYIPSPPSTLKERHSSLTRSIKSLRRRLNLAFFFENSPNFDEFIPYNSHKIPWKIPDLDQTYRCLLDDFCNTISPLAHKLLNSRRSSFSPLDALIYSILDELLLNSSIIIKPADKNLGLCVMNTTDYCSMCLKHLNDVSTYLRLNSPHDVSRCFDSLRRILHIHARLYSDESSELTKLATSLLQLEGHKTLRIAAPFYCLPKLHKSYTSNIPPGRPIVSALSTPTYYTSVYLDKLLQPFIKTLTTPCFSSRSAIKDMQQLSIPTGYIFLCADVASLYPSIPIEFGLKAVRDVLTRLHPSFFSNKEVDFVIDLLEWVLNNNFICFDGVIYHQVKGTAMGTPVAVSYATIVLYAMETPILYHNPIIRADPMLYFKRYIDDIFAIALPHVAAAFIVAFNETHTSIKLESVTQGNTGIFLDLQFHLQPQADGNSLIHHTLYQKPLNKYLYIPPLSLHKPSFFDNFVLQELSRYRLACTSPMAYKEVANLFFVRLLHRGYSFDYLLPLFLQTPSRAHLLKKLFTPATLPRIAPRTPFLTVSMPPLYPYLSWGNLFHIPPHITSTPAYRSMYGRNNIIVSTKNSPNISQLVTRSSFPHTTAPHPPLV
jgi:hypothetical protein